MTLVLFDGFEIAPFTRPSYVNGTCSTLSGRDGIGKCICAPTTATSISIPIPSPPTTIIIGCGIRISSTQAGGTSAVITVCSDGVATSHLSFNFDGLGRMTLRRGTGSGTVIAIGNMTNTFDTWHYVEMKCSIDDVAGTCIIKVDGQTVINYTGDTRNGGTLTTISGVVLALAGSQTQRFDDLVIMDTAGSAPFNDFIGERVVRPGRPSAAGAVSGLTPLAGANYTNVDEDPWTTADYVSGTSGTDTYATSDVSGLTGVDAVQSLVYAMKTDSGPRNVRVVARASDGTTAETADLPLSTTIAAYAGDMMLTDPTGAAWTQALVNSTEFGVKVT